MPDTPLSAPVTPFEDASEMRHVHASLLEAVNQRLGQDSRPESESAALVELAPQIRAFLDRGTATGWFIEDIKERTACQVLLDYWSSTLSHAGVRVVRPRLAPFDAARLPDLKDRPCPFVGLEAFRDPTFFFGRDKAVDSLFKRVAEVPLIIVQGASGSGKSSLVIAGALPMLRATGQVPRFRIVGPFTPGDTVLENLVDAVAAAVPDKHLDGPTEVAALRANAGRLAEILGGAGGPPALLVIDQFEEVFTLCTNQDRMAAVAALDALLKVRENDRVILTLREEFSNELDKLEPLRDYLARHARFSMKEWPMGYDELKAAVERPAALVNLYFAPGIVDELVKSVLGRDTALPLLQFALRSLWDRRERNRITREVHATIGGSPLVALERFADGFYDSLLREQQEEVKRTLLELVRIDRMLEPYRQPRLRSELIAGGNPRTPDVLDLLASEDFVRITPTSGGDDATVEVKHEALLRNWARYLDWINGKRERVRQRIALTEAAQHWSDRGRNSFEGLLSGWQLEDVKELPDLSPLEQGYVQASIDAANSAQRAREQAMLRRQRTKYLVSALVVVIILLFAAVYEMFAAWSAQQAAEEAFEGTTELANTLVFEVVKDVDLRDTLPSEIVNSMFESARRAYDGLIRHNPQNADAYNGRGSAYLATKDFDRAIADFDQAIRLDPNDASYYSNRGTAYRGKKAFERAFDDFSEAIKLEPTGPAGWQGRCFTLAQKGEFERALSDCNESLRLEADQPSALLARGFTLQGLRKFDEAIADFSEVIKINARSWQAYGNRGDAYRLKGKLDEAIKDFDRAIGLNPEAVQSYFLRGLTWRAKGFDDRAIEDYSTVLKLDPTQNAARAARCFARAIAGMLEDALADCTEALKVPPETAGTYDSRGLVYLKLGQFERAIADYNAAVRLDPRHASALYGRGLAKLKNGDAAGGNTDIAAAKMLRSDIADVFTRYGVQ
jgi:tetratricopeptide (TPR) repeat protein